MPPRAIVGGARALLGPAERSRARVASLLESEFEARDLLFTDSGTTGLRLAIQGAARTRPGIVALPAFSCYDVSTAAEGADVPFMLYDVDPHTLSPDMESLRAAIGAGASAIVVAHLYGIPIELAAVLDIAEEEDVLVLEDAAQGAGARYAGRRLGSHGSVGVLSFARGKGITGGGGGALLANDERGGAVLECADVGAVSAARGWRELARVTAMWIMARPGWFGLVASLPFLHVGETVYREPSAPAPASRATLGVLRETWPLGDVEAATRRRNAEVLLRDVRKARSQLACFDPPPNSNPSFLRLPLLASAARLEAAATPEARRLGIAFSYPQPLNRLETSGSLCLNRDSRFPGAEELSRRLITLPTHGRLSVNDLEKLCRWTVSA